jgi:Acetyltransferase (GNAT) family
VSKLCLRIFAQRTTKPDPRSESLPPKRVLPSLRYPEGCIYSDRLLDQRVSFEADLAWPWNIALSEGYRGRGLGRAAIGAIADRCRSDGASRLTVGTSDCSLGTIAFYRKVGFRFAGVRQGYFDTYPVAVVENGIRARDMVMFQMPLTPSSMSNRDGNH